MAPMYANGYVDKRDWKVYEPELIAKKKKIAEFFLRKPTKEELVAELEKMLEKLIQSRELRQQLSRGTRKRFMKKFSLPVFQKRLIRVFKEAMTD